MFNVQKETRHNFYGMLLDGFRILRIAITSKMQFSDTRKYFFKSHQWKTSSVEFN